MRPTTFLFFMAISILSCGSGCGKDDDKWEEVYFEFVMPIEVSPAKDTFRIGEEIKFKAKINDSLYDHVSGKKYHLPNFTFNSFVSIFKINDKSKPFDFQIKSNQKFEVVNRVGGLSNIADAFADLNKIYSNGFYEFDFSIIPKEIGVYHARFVYDAGRKGYAILPQQFAPNEPGVKRFPRMSVLRYTLNNGNTNYNIYSDNAQQLVSSDGTTTFDRIVGYTFVVK
jgi:hypothetical protein